ncbi:MAG TPA: M12 family metallo-peptidase [Anaerolineaceae bacterium]|nr:M12 family metallo-peptidase [Anaerolineaceae bacterium]
MSHWFRLLLGMVLLVTALGQHETGNAYALDGIPDLLDNSEQVQGQAPSRLGVTRSRLVLPRGETLQALQAWRMEDVPEFRLSLSLFADAVFPLRFVRREDAYNGGVTFAGEVDGLPGSEVILSLFDSTLALNLSLPGGVFYQVRPLAGGGHAAYQIDQALFPDEADPLPAKQAGSVALQTAGDDDGSLVEMMVVYTADALSDQGGVSAMNSLINLAVAETNQGYINSQVNQRVRLVYSGQVTYSEAGKDWANFNTWVETLNALTGTADGVMDNVHPWRDTYRADVTVLLLRASGSNYCGVSWMMQAPSTSFAPNAFSLVANDCATGYYSFAHETGHVMGSQHDRANAGGAQGTYAYSYGYQDPNRAFRTIMAYNCVGNCPRVNYWSNPNLTYNGSPMGIPAGQAQAADNHLSLNNTAIYVANFRDGYAPNPPTGLNGTPATNTASITVSWTDTSSDEKGFKLERAIGASGSWSLLATVGSNGTQYIDAPVSCNSFFRYRVSAYGANGDSATSNEVSVQPCPKPQAPSAMSATPLSPWSIRVQWQDNSSNEDSFVLERSPNGSADWQVVSTLGVNAALYLDRYLNCNARYYYRVKAQNVFGSSAYAVSAWTDTQACTAPDVPLGLRGVPTYPGAVYVTWERAGGAATYTVEHSLNNLDWNVVGSVPANVWNIGDSGLTPGAPVYYRAVAQNAWGTSAYSTVVAVMVNAYAVFLPVVSR